MTTCRLHNLPYVMCCPVCDAEYAYVGRAHVLPEFRRGFADGSNGARKAPHGSDDKQAAYLDGYSRGSK